MTLVVITDHTLKSENKNTDHNTEQVKLLEQRVQQAQPGPYAPCHRGTNHQLFCALFPQVLEERNQRIRSCVAVLHHLLSDSRRLLSLPSSLLRRAGGTKSTSFWCISTS